MNLDQGGAALAEAPVILGQTAHAGTVLGAEGAQPGSAGLAPTQHRGRMERPVPRGAVTGWLAAAGLQFVDGPFQQLTKRKDLPDEAAAVLQQTEEDVPLAAGPIQAKSQNNSLSLCYKYY